MTLSRRLRAATQQKKPVIRPPVMIRLQETRPDRTRKILAVVSAVRAPCDARGGPTKTANQESLVHLLIEPAPTWPSANRSVANQARARNLSTPINVTVSAMQEQTLMQFSVLLPRMTMTESPLARKHSLLPNTVLGIRSQHVAT